MRRRYYASACALVAMVGAGAPTTASAENLRERYDRLHDAATEKFGKKVVGRDIARYGMPVTDADPAGWSDKFAPTRATSRSATGREMRTSMRRMDRWLTPPKPQQPQPTSSSGASAPAAAVAPQQGGNGRWAIPESIVMCESGGNYNARNPSGAYGAYQIMPGTARAHGCSLATPAGQDACAAKIWAGGAGRSQWVC